MGCFRQIISNVCLCVSQNKESLSVVHFQSWLSLLAFPNSHPVAVGSVLLFSLLFCLNVSSCMCVFGAPFAGRGGFSLTFLA